MQLRDLLSLHGVDPQDCNVMLHSPRHREFARVLPTLVHTRRAALDRYQSTHNAPAQNALCQGRAYVAVFVRVADSQLVFAGTYRNPGPVTRSWGEILADPEARFLSETYGIFAAEAALDPATTTRWFDLALTDRMVDLIGRLVIRARLTQTYVRLAENIDAPVAAILEDGIAEVAPPPWREIAVSAAFLRALPNGWATRLAQWRGVYLIVDEVDGARYVGSAYGETNLLGRWQAHVARDVGVTAQLGQRNPLGFRFSILERVSPDMPADEVIALEHTWMERLHTRQFGLNA